MSSSDPAAPPVSATPAHPLAGTVALCLLMLPVMLAGWFASFAPFDDLLNTDGKPLLADFICFYIAGECVADGHFERLYDDLWAHQRSAEIIPQLQVGMNLPYRYPPFFAALAAPLAWFTFPVACGLFLGLQVAGLVGLFLCWRHELPTLQALKSHTFVAVCLGFPLTMECLMGGQLSVFTLLILGSTVLLIRRGRLVAAGAVLGLVMFKPNVALLFILGCVLRFPKMFLGLVLTGFGMLTFTLATTGVQTLQDYVHLGQTLATQTWQTAAPTWKIHGLEPLIAACIPQHSKLMTLSLGAGLVLLTAIAWRRRLLSDADGFSLLFVINALFGMYVPIYDLLLLLPVLWLQSEQGVLNAKPECRPMYPWRMASPATLPALGLLIAMGPHLSQALVMETGLQPFSVIMWLAVVWSLLHSSRDRLPKLHAVPEVSLKH